MSSGYQPDGKNKLDTEHPPQGGSGVPRKTVHISITGKNKWPINEEWVHSESLTREQELVKRMLGEYRICIGEWLKDHPEEVNVGSKQLTFLQGKVEALSEALFKMKHS